ncbi:hypothetical protein PGT21_023429 [Puccinia graminis f. sp. tritici]|uniref:Uncharacterized protein n=1 Tax=Puccinia graminis f. sp. tritici TaxID=56615 RepID=A0A5B0PFL2_PUCGR|nr:hypothetical protein PGT21_023429 [Puccinia graminis f. sp. tritici]
MGPINNHPTQQEFQCQVHPRVPHLGPAFKIVDCSQNGRSGQSQVDHQAAWGFINDSLMSPLCLVAKPKLIAASAFLLAISHHLSKSPPSYPDQEGNHREPHNIEKNPVDFHCFLNHPPRDGPKEGLIQ